MLTPSLSLPTISLRPHRAGCLLAPGQTRIRQEWQTGFLHILPACKSAGLADVAGCSPPLPGPSRRANTLVGPSRCCIVVFPPRSIPLLASSCRRYCLCRFPLPAAVAADACATDRTAAMFELVPKNVAELTVIASITPDIVTVSFPFRRYGLIKIGGRGTISMFRLAFFALHHQGLVVRSYPCRCARGYGVVPPG